MIKAVAITACISTALAATASIGADLSKMSGSIEACLTPSQDIDDVLARLTDEGWSRIDGALPGAVIERLIWPQITVYATGDTGGEELKALADLQRKTVAGFVRKKDIPSSKTRILARQDEAAIVLWLRPSLETAEVKCSFALSNSSLAPYAGGDFDNDVMEPARGQQIEITKMNPTSLSEKLDAPLSVTGVLKTTSTFSLEAK